MTKTVTLVIHGTFASHATWWRLGGDGATTFADRLEAELSRHGLAGTVWKPALAEGFDYASFSWSGLNRHRDRLHGARRLSDSLNTLAQRSQATAEAPLTVNLVAHSHGGNVVLEALRHLTPNVRIGRVVLLGTPLVTVKPAFRVARFVLATILAALLFLFLMFMLIELGSYVFTGHALEAERLVERGGEFVRETSSDGLGWWVIPTLVAYGWVFWLLGNLLDVAWRVVCRVFEPIAWLRGRSRSLVYGPAPRRLAAILDGQPVLLLTTRNDEADLLLQVGSGPARLYTEYVATKFSLVGRAFEFIFLRPFVFGVFLKLSELFLEVLSLGMSVWRASLQDFEVAPLAQRPYYPAHLLVQEALDVRPKAVTSKSSSADPAAQAEHRTASGALLSRGLTFSLQEVTEELTRQIQLRHSTYYEDDTVTARVAAFLTGAEAKVAPATPRPVLPPPSEFWELLLAANVALVALYAWAAEPPPMPPALMSTVVFLMAYFLPFGALGLGLAVYFPLRRKLPEKLGRTFWILWAIGALMILITAITGRVRLEQPHSAQAAAPSTPAACLSRTYEMPRQVRPFPLTYA